MRSLWTLPIAGLVILVTIPGVASSIDASPFVGGANDWSLVNHPSIVPIGCCEAGQAVYHNNLNVDTFGIPVMVIRNNLGQTLYINYVSLAIAAGANGTAYHVIFNSGILQEGNNYNATFFAIGDGGVAMSNSTTTVVTFP